MVQMLTDDPVLTRAARWLERVYGDKVLALLLYGSRARGDHRPESDYDLAVIVADEATAARVPRDRRALHAAVMAGDAPGDDVRLRVLTPGSFATPSSFLMNLRKDALPVADFPGTPAAFAHRRPLRDHPMSMSPEAAHERAKATSAMETARRLGRYGEWPLVARETYSAAFHAATAVVIAATGLKPKTHKGLWSSFAQVGRDLRGMNADTAAFLGRGFDFKHVVDYGDRDELGQDDAQEALADAEAFLAMVDRMLAEIEDASRA